MKKHTSHFWLELFEIELIDPDGWCGIDIMLSMADRLLVPITVEEFAIRISNSTILHHNNDKLKILDSIR